MNSYVTGNMIKELREKLGMTQGALAEKLGVSDKAVSKWETGKGYPDITLIEPLSEALGVSVIELFSGMGVSNRNMGANMKRTLFHVCPVCGNMIISAGDAVVCCHGITLPSAEADRPDDAHGINITVSEDEYYVTVDHEMSKSHHISFIARVADNSVSLVKLYPEQAAEARFKISRTEEILIFCNRHGLFRLPRKEFQTAKSTRN